MKSIQNILQTDGIEFIDSLMNDYLVVYEKLNASTLSFRRIGNELKFYKGRDNEEITSLNETLYSYFKDGIEYIRRVSLVFYMEFPERWLFRLQWFNPNSSNLVNYQNQPKNNLVLSCIDTGNSIIEDLNVLKKWADRLQIDISEPVFSGFLSEFQKDKLVDYVEGKCECNVPFSQYIISILNPGVSHSAFSDTFNTIIDSFIFKFYKAGSKKCIAMKLVDPYIDQMLKQNKDKFGDNSGTENEIILANFIAWLQTIDLNDFDVEGDTKEDRYLDLLCKLFNKYIEKEQKLFKDMKSDINESYQVNIDNIKNEDTAKLLKENPHLSTVFQVIVGSFIDKKDTENNPLSIMDDTLKELFNKEVSSIKRITDDKDEQVKSFTELMKSSMNNIETAPKDSKDEKIMSFSELMDKIGYSEDDSTDENEQEIDKKEEQDESEKDIDKKENTEKEKSDKKDDEDKTKTDSEENKSNESDNKSNEKIDKDSNDEDKKSEESKSDEEKQDESEKDNDIEKNKSEEDNDSEKSDENDKKDDESNDSSENDKENENKSDNKDNSDEQKVIDKKEPEKTAPEPKASKEKPEQKDSSELEQKEKPEKKKTEKQDDVSMSL